ncbi:CaiB/BaiF CoA transferase family protein [Parafilimonas terrae]|jgi:crotonobetainyl-CoA:carnitine CoA-transferase CaiB-like acyl-CoA transferase|uniref:Crotonobetainyl-CoA:carnitine CoA-transferase CaiB n=1 Tax=Parafilimonas terrae TaxID=1465490 RepID=A0A1I5TN91_9BACT|nr:CaiB/BaiF CoA-transferase family protein [Parafilimonas terrae]SFP84351.1 Crotonobetainyl-CoA:carnitine CoA-transferase CaiB [Parafilimonas terrae]
MKNRLPLKGVTILEFSQYLSGPSAGLRLADFGARVIKIERPETGDAGRKLAIKNMWAGSDSLLFNTINRNKESAVADLKNEDDRLFIQALIKKADVITHNFRPGVMEKYGLGYNEVKKINASIIYASISGYGNTGPWKNLPGQDLLLQAVSGLAYTTGNHSDAPVPFGLSIGDYMAGSHLAQGILAALIRRHKTKQPALIEVSLLESILDFQFELLTTFYANGIQPKRSEISNGNPLLAPPYGIYKTKDGYIAIAMTNLDVLAHALDCDAILLYEQEHVFIQRDAIKKLLADHLATHITTYWLEKLHRQKIWAIQVLNWKQLRAEEAYKGLKTEQHVELNNGGSFITTRCPVKINGEYLFSAAKAPALGEHNQKIKQEINSTIKKIKSIA